MKVNLFDKINKNKQNTFFIHYSCQSLGDNNEGLSPRITSIAVLHCASSQMRSFSMHLSAEELGIGKVNISLNYDKIEKNLLEHFAKFVKDSGNNSYWVHWNMSNINFGFEAIEHRYKVLTKKDMVHIPEINRFNLSTLLKKKYGNKYADDPKMIKLMEMNGGKHRSVLSGEEEVRAFKAAEFVKMHNSTMSKVYFFNDSFNKALNNNLITRTNQFRYKINQLYQNPFVQLLSIIGVFVSLISLFENSFN